MATQKPETVFDIEALFSDINRSFLTAARQLQETFEEGEWMETPYVYHMPKMHLSMRLALSHSDGKIKGVFSKRSSKTEESVTSLVEVDVVAMPRQPVEVDMKWLQDSLNKLMKVNLAVDGVFGEESRKALQRFQKKQGLAQDGLPRLQTIKKIREVLKTEGLE
jgi:murein L,D-transpeptidase YcbB/YkuD